MEKEGTATAGEATAAPPPPPPRLESEVVVLRRHRHEMRLKNATTVLRAVSCLFSALAFIVMVTNKHGDWKEFNKYEEFRYAAAIFALGFLYAAAKLVLLSSRGDYSIAALSPRAVAMVDFATDQVLAYLLISAVSAAIPLTNRMREGADNIFTDALGGSIGMAFLAFVAVALSAMVAGYKLTIQTCI
ncbi:CASP-like protein 4B4 isoform X2 [Wolffia australiana]